MISQEEEIEVSNPLTIADRRAFLRLPIEERRRRLAEQASQMAEEYDLKSSLEQRLEWQGGDILDC